MVALMGAEVAVGVAGGISAYVMSRRKVPWNLAKALHKDDLQLPPGMTQEYKLPETDRVKLKEAFLNNTEFKWLSTQPGVEDRNFPNHKVMLDITWYMVECALRFVEKFGFLLVQRDPHSGDFLGAIGLIPPYQKYWRYLSHYRLAALTLGRVSVPQRRGCPRRYKAFQKTTQEVQRQSVLNSPKGMGHWSIPIVGVASSAQRHGVGRQLVETATRICPRPIYASVSEDRINFFQKCGFVLEKRFQLAAEGGNQDPENDIIFYNAMTCQ